MTGRGGRLVLVVGDPTAADLQLIETLRSRALHVSVAAEPEALRRLAGGERPNAVLLLGSYCDPDALVDRIRGHDGLAAVPVMLYSTEDRRDPPPDELAALIAAAASMSGSTIRA